MGGNYDKVVIKLTSWLIFVSCILIFPGFIKLTSSSPASSLNSSLSVVHENKLGHEEQIPFSSDIQKSLCYNKSDGIFNHPSINSTCYRCKSGDYKLAACDSETATGNQIIQNEISVIDQSALSTSFICNDQPNAFFPVYNSNCQYYYRCEKDLANTTLTCESDSRFSVGDQLCRPAEEVPCIQAQCAASATGLFIMPGSKCKVYYSCNNGTKTNYLCPAGQTFDRANQVCSNSEKTCYELVCAGRVNGEYPDTTHDCKRYFTCEGGEIKTITNCPEHQRFNGTECLDTSSVICGSSRDMAVGFLSRLEDRCTGYDDGVYSASDVRCKEYFLCKSERMLVQLECPEGQRFDGQKCMSAELVPCYSYCTGRKDGYHANLKKECREYVRCMNEQTVEEKSCAPETIFNGQMCIPKNIYTCPSFNENVKSFDRCDFQNDGFHTDYLSSCRSYFECLNGKTINYHTCSNGKWDGQQCVEDLFCSSPQESPVCLSQANGLYADRSTASQCKSYYYCFKGKQVRLACPNGKVFDGVGCVSEDSYKCPVVESDCLGEREGYYVDSASSCRAYYYCSDGNKVSYVCPQGQVFNGKECVISTAYSCPLNISSECKTSINGYFADINSDCEKYFYCLDGDRVMTFNCPPGEKFDGYKCSHQSQSICQKTSKLPCRFLKDGYYIHPESDCQRYFKCSNREMIENRSCLDGYSFDGVTCVVMSISACHETMQQQSENLTKCKKYNNGFFPDIQSGCQSYFYCIEGEKSLLKCPPNKIFNGEVCVDELSFHCPIYMIVEQKLDDLQTQ